MKPLYTQLEYDNSKSEDKLSCKCYQCNKPFKVKKKYITLLLSGKPYNQNKFCSIDCISKNRTKKKNVICKNCGKTFLKSASEIKKSKNHFCSQSCSGTYNNKHKTHGTRRSKLEVYLEEQLVELYPKTNFHFNRKDTINSELDIYIPSLKLAFELNGIFHYEPIFGPEKLSKIQNNDERKFQACLENNIELVLIDTSSQKYFKSKSSQKFLNIISEIINKKL